MDDATLARIEAAAALRGLSLDAFFHEALRLTSEGTDGGDAAWRAFVQRGIESADRGERIGQDAMESW
ncbi:hypothetical protein, partial [Clostridium perfringens]